MGLVPFRDLIVSGHARMLGTSRLAWVFPTWFDTSYFADSLRWASSTAGWAPCPPDQGMTGRKHFASRNYSTGVGLQTVMVTLEPLPTDAPPAGFWVTTRPSCVVGQSPVVAGSAVSPALLSVAVA